VQVKHHHLREKFVRKLLNFFRGQCYDFAYISAKTMAKIKTLLNQSTAMYVHSCTQKIHKEIIFRQYFAEKSQSQTVGFGIGTGAQKKNIFLTVVG
jgi:hypothetical protein